MTPAVYGIFARSHHFQKHGHSRKIRNFLPHNQVDVIDGMNHLECDLIDQAYLLKLLGNSQPAHSVFAIQVKKIEPSSVGNTKILSLVREDMDKYKIHIPTSMAKV